MTFPRATEHGDTCEWHHDQYPWECTCGAIPEPHKFMPKWLKATQRPHLRKRAMR